MVACRETRLLLHASYALDQALENIEDLPWVALLDQNRHSEDARDKSPNWDVVVCPEEETLPSARELQTSDRGVESRSKEGKSKGVVMNRKR